MYCFVGKEIFEEIYWNWNELIVLCLEVQWIFYKVYLYMNKIEMVDYVRKYSFG